MDRAAFQRAFPAFILYAAISLVFCLPLLAQPLGLGAFDWDQHFFYYAQVLKNVGEYAQLPFWSPWYCGGDVLWQNPQTALLSPVYPLAAIIPLALAMKVNIILHYWIGLVGMHLLLTEVIGLTFLPLVVYLSSMFALAGANTMHLAVGHSVFLPVFYLPLQFFFFLRALSAWTLRAALYAAGLLALMVYNGGLHVVPMAVIGLGAFAVCLAMARRSLRPLLLVVLVTTAGLAYSAPKLVPVALFVGGDRFWDTRNPIEHPDLMTGEMLVRAYADPSQTLGSRYGSWQRSGWWEYGNYIGPAILLILVAMAWAFVCRTLPERGFAIALGVTSATFLALSAGELGPFAPASLLHHVPFFSQFRIPSRYTIPFVLYGTLTLAYVARTLEGQATGTLARRACLATACVLAFLQLAAVNRAPFENVFSGRPLERDFRWLGGTGKLVIDADTSPASPDSPMLRALMSDRAIYYCYESLQLTRGATFERPLVYSDGKARISSIEFSPNRVRFSVVAGFEASKAYLNQNYAPGWHSDAGPVLFEARDGGRAYVELPAGRAGRFSFTFVPPGLIASSVLCALAVTLSVLVWHGRLPW